MTHLRYAPTAATSCAPHTQLSQPSGAASVPTTSPLIKAVWASRISIWLASTERIDSTRLKIFSAPFLMVVPLVLISYPYQTLSRELQSLLADDFLYFFLRLRKHRIRALVQALQARYRDESREQLARRLIASHAELSFLGGALLHLPTVLPGLGQLWQMLGFVGGIRADAQACLPESSRSHCFTARTSTIRRAFRRSWPWWRPPLRQRVHPAHPGARGLNPLLSLPLVGVTPPPLRR
jgi:hypothetical protein